MKTTIDIPQELLTAVMKFSGAKTKRDAVIAAMEDYHHRQEAEAFFKRIEENPLRFMSNDEIEAADVAEATRQLADYQSRGPER